MRNISEKEKENALNEIRILANLHHPNIISYKDAFMDAQSNTLWYIKIFIILLIYKFSPRICRRWRFILENFLTKKKKHVLQRVRYPPYIFSGNYLQFMIRD
jgi:serine/threonine protein kinase